MVFPHNTNVFIPS